ncbi:helix-turn-helix domain-containing protein [Pseudoalteromonas piscicida]|uniref:helix-turn-helix domain-containing protein n=1 Tax=Pseudoalteromonas piscicida TaxID=43662 RepID=UPI0027E3DE0C|nr:helix-turn-helix transcriptional regulator [Pseudoalteromonas piscicida]
MNHYEKGRHIPNLYTLKRIADELGVPLNYFFCESDEMAKYVEMFYRILQDEQINILKELKKKF